MSDLAAQVKQLQDTERARNFAMRYADVVDALDAVGAGNLFTPEGVLSLPGGRNLAGREAIAEFYQSRFGEVDRRHFITNTTTAPAGDGLVRVRSYFFFTSREPELSVLGWGRYIDLVDVSGDEPLLAHKTIEPEFFTNLAAGWAL